MNIVEPILYQCKLNPYAIAIAAPGSAIQSLKYGQLERVIHNIARSAIKAGLKPGDVVAVAFSEQIFHAMVILGLSRLGIVTMSLVEGNLPEHIIIDAIVTDVPQSFSGARNVIAISASWFEGDGAPLDYDRIYRSKGDDDCCIILTTGSTGKQKGVALTHKMLAERIGHYGYTKGALFSRTSRVWCDLGISSISGFMYFFYMLFHGGTTYFSGRKFEEVLQYLDAYKIEALTTSPFNLDGMLKILEADPALGNRLSLIICLGARLSQEFSKRVRARLCPNLFSSYGTTETTTVAFGSAHIISRRPGAVGFICPSVTVEIVDQDDKLLPLGREGSIRVRSPHLARGYVGDLEATAKMFRDGTFYSGDLGYISAEGMLVITGRESSVLNVGGDKIAPEIVEEVLCGFPGITQAAAVNLNDTLGIPTIHALIVAQPDLDERALRTHCESKLRKLFVPLSFISVDDIPRSGHGKIDRQRVVDLAKARLTPV